MLLWIMMRLSFQILLFTMMGKICQKGRVPNEEMVNQVVEIRVKTALLSGASVILDASDLRKTRREHYLQLAEECRVKQIQTVKR